MEAKQHATPSCVEKPRNFPIVAHNTKETSSGNTSAFPGRPELCSADAEEPPGPVEMCSSADGRARSALSATPIECGGPLGHAAPLWYGTYRYRLSYDPSWPPAHVPSREGALVVHGVLFCSMIPLVPRRGIGSRWRSCRLVMCWHLTTEYARRRGLGVWRDPR